MSDYLTTEQAGAEIGMSPDYVARQCKSGALKAKKLGTEWRIHRAALEQFMTGAEPAPATRKRLSARQMRRAS
jgi:excisionase family DNA binding protein